MTTILEQLAKLLPQKSLPYAQSSHGGKTAPFKSTRQDHQDAGDKLRRRIRTWNGGHTGS